MSLKEVQSRTAQEIAEYCKSQLPETWFAYASDDSAVAQFDPASQKWVPVLARLLGGRWAHAPAILANGRCPWADKEWQEVTLPRLE